MQELANTAWTFATAGQSNAQVFPALAKAVKTHTARVTALLRNKLVREMWTDIYNSVITSSMASESSNKVSIFMLSGSGNSFLK